MNDNYNSNKYTQILNSDQQRWNLAFRVNVIDDY